MLHVESGLARLIDSVGTNTTLPVEIAGRRCFLKRRRIGRGLIIMAGNRFLKGSRSRIVMFPRCADWQAWELHSYRLLHGTERISQQPDAASILVEALPGTSFDEHRRANSLTPDIFHAAGREFHRVHALHSALIPGAWSHGDPHLRNVLYDSATKQVYLIDFETRHEPGLSAIERHADDLLVFLLDLCGSASGDWADQARVFLAAYARPEVNAALLDRLHVPHGLELVLWRLRTHYLAHDELTYRLAVLRQVIQGQKLI